MSEDEGENGGDSEEVAVSVESLRERLEAIRERLDDVETEDALDDVEADVDDLEADVEAADFPEPDDEETPPAEELESEIEDVRENLEEQRGPYAEDVVEKLEEASGTIADTRWTEDGLEALGEAVRDFRTAAGNATGERYEREGRDDEGLAATVDAVAEDVGTTDLDPDEDAETIADLLEAAQTLADAVDDAEEWDDLSTREQLQAQGFYDVLDHRKDFPPEWHAIKVHEQNDDPEMILLAYEAFDSDFMEDHCIEAFRRLGAEEALDAMTQRAQRRENDVIEVLGKIASEDPLDMLMDYADTDGDPGLQKVSLRALGEIGSHEATQTVADQLASEDAEIRSHAARALGLLGDTRAIAPLADVLEEDEVDTVRASAAWALNQIGTERALETVQEYVDDRDYLVQSEAEKAAEVGA